jgi:hypothetical protein
MSKEGKQAFLDAIHGGKGFIGMHSATDTFHSKGDQVDPHQDDWRRVYLPRGAAGGPARRGRSDFPGVNAFGRSLRSRRVVCPKHLADDLHVIIAP